MSEKILVTGAAGFIGSHLVERLLAEGFAVVGLDNLVLGRMENLRGALQNSQFSFMQNDLLEEDSCFEALKGQPFHSVWHLAANSDILAGVSDPRVDLNNTFLSTYHTLNLMKRLGAKRLVFASTSSIYGEKSAAIHEDMGPLFPISNYGAMKLASEGMISAALEKYLDQAWIFRFPNVVGPRATHGVILDFLRKLQANPLELRVLGDGTQQKPYLHVNELIEAMVFALRHAEQRLNYFNFGQDGSATTVRYIAERVCAAVQPNAKIYYGVGNKGWHGDVPRFSYCIDKIKELGWSPKLSSDESVETAIREISQEMQEHLL